MPGPWISAKDNPDFMAQRAWRTNEFFESTVYDDSGKSQGKTIWNVLGVRKESNAGFWLNCQLEVVEDGDLHWWLTKGPGKVHTRLFKVHVCQGPASKCRQNRDKKDDTFHLDYLRMLDVDDLRFRRQSWWQVGCAKGDFEKFRNLKMVLEGASRLDDPGGDEYPLPFDDVEVAEALEGEEPAAAASARPDTGRLARDLDQLKGELSKSEPKRKAARAEGAPPRRVVLKEATAPPAEAEKEAADGEADGPAWFGVRLKRNKTKEAPKKKKKIKKKKTSAEEDSSRTSTEARKKRARKKADRGPYGVGERLEFGDVGQSGSSDEEEQVFRGGVSEKRSHQLKLVEYALQKPGRLTSRLLLKMQQLLARESGTPITDLSRLNTLTPPTATSYLLTILVPTHKERLGIRLLREMRTLTAALDDIARGESARAGDILSQRLKALELQLTDNGWQRAQFLELIPPEGAGLAERSEQAMAAREQAAEAKIRQLVFGRSGWDQPENSKGKGKSKGGKGKKGQGSKHGGPGVDKTKTPVA